MKKFFTILLILILIAGIGVGVWYFFFGKETFDINDPFNNSFGSFFDVDNSGNSDFQSQTNNEEGNVNFIEDNNEVTIPSFRQLSVEPVAGFTFYTRETDPEVASTTSEGVFRFMERATGHIYETTDNNSTLTKISNTTVQKVNKAIFFEDSNKMIFEILSSNGETIDTYSAELTQVSTTTDELELETNIYALAASDSVLSPDKEEFAYQIKNINKTDFYTNDSTLVNTDLIFESPLRDWNLSWDASNFLSLTTKPSSNSPGYFYSLNLTSGSFNKLISGVNGLTAKLSPNAKYVLYSESSNNSIILRGKNLETGELRIFNFYTLPEKCVFSTSDDSIVYCAGSRNQLRGAYPDAWYKGLGFHTDNLFKINLDNGLIEDVYVFDSEEEGVFDAIELTLVDDERFLMFVNKRDLSLWSLELKTLDNTDDFTIDSAEQFDADF